MHERLSFSSVIERLTMARGCTKGVQLKRNEGTTDVAYIVTWSLSLDDVSEHGCFVVPSVILTPILTLIIVRDDEGNCLK